MNKPIGIFILAALLLCANASFIEHLYNSTHLKGDVKVDTDNGLKVGYNGNLYFDNGILGFEIANLGGKFNAALRPGSKFGNQTNGTVDYSGEIQVAQGKHRANISVDGTAGLNSEYEKECTETGGNLTYHTKLTNKNQWTVNAGGETVEGNTEAALHINGKVVKDGNEIYIKKKLSGGVAHEGSFNGTDFSSLSLGKVGIKQKVYVRNDSDSEGDILSDILPTVGYHGKAKVARLSHIEVGEDTVTTLGGGGGVYGGVIWYDKKDDNDTFIRAVKHSKSADFIHGGKVIVNDRLHAVYGGVGTTGALVSAEGKVTKDAKNFTAGGVEFGNSHYIGVTIVNPRDEDEKALEKQMAELQKNPMYGVDNIEYEEDDDKSNVDHHRRRKIKAYVNTKWAAGKGVNAQRTDNNTIDVESHGGVVWDVTGHTSDSRRPFHDRGAKSYNTTFEIDPKAGTVRNMLLRYGNNPRAIEEIKKRYQKDHRGIPQMM